MSLVSRPLCTSLLVMLLTGCTLANPGGGTGVTTQPLPTNSVRQTGRMFDVAIKGDGYFTLRDLVSGKAAFTRYGRFRLTAEGSLVTPDSRFVVEPSITIPTDAVQAEIGADGMVKARQPCTVAETAAAKPICALQPVAQFLLSRFNGQQSLREISPGRFEATSNIAPRNSAPGTNGAGTLMVGSLEEPPKPVVSAPVTAADTDSHIKCAATVPLTPVPQATLMQTGKKLDLAVQGEAYFMVRNPDNGQINYTRHGQFALSAAGKLRHQDGKNELLVTKIDNGPGLPTDLSWPADTTQVEITATGLVSIARTSAPGLQPFGQMQLARFPNREGLKQTSPRVFEETCASGPSLITKPQVGGSAGGLILGSLEEDVAEGAVGTVLSQLWHVAPR